MDDIKVNHVLFDLTVFVAVVLGMLVGAYFAVTVINEEHESFEHCLTLSLPRGCVK